MGEVKNMYKMLVVKRNHLEDLDLGGEMLLEDIF